MATFLLKTEPTEYSFADLQRDRKCSWEGVSNGAALAALRSVRVGDELFIYHTGDEKAIVGLARVSRAPYEDPTRPGRTPQGLPKFAVIDIVPVRAVSERLTLTAIKSDARFESFQLVTQSRLSVMRVPPALDRVIRSLCGL